MPRLDAISFLRSPQGLGSLTRIDVDRPAGNVVGWSASIRGPAVFLVSPPGWERGQQEAQRKHDGPRKVIEVPRAECHLEWSIGLDEEMSAIGEKLGRHDSSMFVSPTDRARMESEALERATAPKAKAR